MKSKQTTKDKAANQRADKNKGLVQRTTIGIKNERTAQKSSVCRQKKYILIKPPRNGIAKPCLECDGVVSCSEGSKGGGSRLGWQ